MAYQPLLLTTVGHSGRLVNSVSSQAGKPRLWSYMSDDDVATVRVAGYIADGWLRGMRKGDLVYVVVTAAGDVTAASLCTVMTCTKADGADLSNGVSVTVTNSD